MKYFSDIVVYVGRAYQIRTRQVLWINQEEVSCTPVYSLNDMVKVVQSQQ